MDIPQALIEGVTQDLVSYLVEDDDMPIKQALGISLQVWGFRQAVWQGDGVLQGQLRLCLRAAQVRAEVRQNDSARAV